MIDAITCVGTKKTTLKRNLQEIYQALPLNRLDYILAKSIIKRHGNDRTSTVYLHYCSAVS